jgi:hypothetical protein
VKIRSGFVSNSSSSSFIVGFEKVPTTVEEMEAVLFDDAFPDLRSPWDWEDLVYDAHTVATTVFGDLKKRELTRAQLLDMLDSGSLSDNIIPGNTEYPETPDYDKDREKWDAAWERYYAEKKVYIQKVYDHVLAPHRGRNAGKNKLHFYGFTYSDEDGGYGSTLEHGGLFRRVFHIHISQH